MLNPTAIGHLLLYTITARNLAHFFFLIFNTLQIIHFFPLICGLQVYLCIQELGRSLSVKLNDGKCILTTPKNQRPAFGSCSLVVFIKQVTYCLFFRFPSSFFSLGYFLSFPIFFLQMFVVVFSL